MILSDGYTTQSFFGLGEKTNFSLFKYGMYISLSGNFFVLSSNKKMFFQIDENNNLRISKFFVKFTFLNGEDDALIEICNTSSNLNIKVTVDLFDFKTVCKFGSFARIFHPDIKTNSTEKITRVTTCDQMFECNDLEKQSLLPFCLFPIEQERSGEFVIQTFKKCTNSDFFKEFFKDYSLSNKLKKFRYLFTALKSFKENNFFHTDIKITNIVLENDEFKFIDLDLSCFIDKPERSIEIITDSLVYTFPTFLNIDMIYYMLKNKNDIYFEINAHSNKSIIKYITYLKAINPKSDIPKLVDSNLSPLPYNITNFFNLHLKKTQEEKLNVFHYASIYQLIISLYEFVNYTETYKYQDIIEEFFYDILNFQINGLQSIDDVLDKYDSMIINIQNKEELDKEGLDKANENSKCVLGKRLYTLTEQDFWISDDSLELSSDSQSFTSSENIIFDSDDSLQFELDDF